MRRLTTLFPLLLVSCVLSGCWGSSEPEPEPEATELKVKGAEHIDAPEGDLFHNAKQLYSVGLFSIARESFESLRNTYPLSPYAEFAEIKSADSHFETREYSAAAVAYEEFAKNHPASTALSYVLMQAGRSHQLAQHGLGRDTSSLHKAIEYYDRLLANDPDSIYSASAQEYKHEAMQTLASHEKFVLDFYRKKRQDKAVDARERVFAEKWQPILSQPDEVKILKVNETGRAPAPKVMLVSRGRSETLRAPQIIAANTSARAEAAAPQIRTDLPYRIEQVECRTDGGKRIVIHLNKNLEDDLIQPTIRGLRTENSTLSLAIPRAAGRTMTIDCFGTRDLTMSDDARVSVALPHDLESASADAMALDNPPRLLVALH